MPVKKYAAATIASSAGEDQRAALEAKPGIIRQEIAERGAERVGDQDRRPSRRSRLSAW